MDSVRAQKHLESLICEPQPAPIFLHDSRVTLNIAFTFILLPSSFTLPRPMKVIRVTTLLLSYIFSTSMTSRLSTRLRLSTQYSAMGEERSCESVCGGGGVFYRYVECSSWKSGFSRLKCRWYDGIWIRHGGGDINWADWKLISTSQFNEIRVQNILLLKLLLVLFLLASQLELGKCKNGIICLFHMFQRFLIWMLNNMQTIVLCPLDSRHAGHKRRLCEMINSRELLERLPL